MYRKYSTDCHEQLFKDFGEFPPKPLRAPPLKHTFDVIYLSGIGSKYYSLSRVFGLFKADEDEIEDENVRLMHKEVQDVKYGLVTSLQDLVFKFKKLNLLNKTLSLLLVILISPLFLIFFAFLLIILIYRLYRIPSLGLNSLGFFSPITQQKSEIVVKPRDIKNAGLSLDAIVSHEHIHLLQFRKFPDRQNDLLGTDFKASVKNVLKDSAKRSGKAFYYLSINEVEARLHEVVLSYYRAYQSLPHDYRGFLVMILSCEVLGGPVSKILSNHEVELQEYVFRDFNLREVAPAQDLAIMLGYFKDFSYSKRFVCESLSVMYGNLLMLYGDTQKAINYLKTIECSDFYLQLYGEPSVPMDRAGE
ncbi:hypothetical protein FMN52_00950 [Marinobacter sp. BW6]|uniref:hypothetical protein n=1 Tax=Marinobacter sp. BW6 TaxID=2592624 RepID=UPI0011DE5F0D|nr:hypothetical protein [Marinobacter sp. BW6]TYC63824.1 hypothetical protein FMN52_00950 [Marinobacter sp. BW6]